MGFAINHNLNSINGLNAMDITTKQVSSSLQKLSTGLRINTAADDASGLAISEKFRAQINGMQTAKINAQEGISMLQTAEGSLNEVSSILQRINTLAVRSANDVTLTNANRVTMDQEVQGLKAELDRIAQNITFNTKVLLDGTLSGNLQVGAGATADNQITVSIGSVTAANLGLTATDVTTSANALTAIGVTNTAIDTVSTTRGSIGVVQNRLQHTITNLDTSVTNTTASESSIRDVDMASEISNLTRLQILQQADVAMLAQANSQPQAVLSLLKG
ncbi:MAG: flagellin FliC [Candidatus Firestonebacteria bacterium]|nr:flagellin FliC [Candidatus Firestonebacteria bacterium]